MLSENGQGQYYYIGWGEDAWEDATGLLIGDSTFTYKGNDIYHKGNPPSLTDLGLTATAAELNYVDGVTSNVQAQLDDLQPIITGGASTITTSNLTANRVLISNASGKVAVSSVTSTELRYLDGVTSNIQTQLNNKVNENIVNVTLLSGSSNWTSSTGAYYQDISVSGMTSSIIVNVIGNFTTSSGLQEIYNTLTRVQSISGAVRIWSNEPTSTDLPIILHYFN